FFWGDCSLSNTLFRLDAGALAAYIVDVETSELHPSLSDGQREMDLEVAGKESRGGVLRLGAGGLLATEVDPLAVPADLTARYHALWDELTGEWDVAPGEERTRVAERMVRLNELGFDVDEVELVADSPG